MRLVEVASVFAVGLLPAAVFCEKLAPLPESALRFDPAVVGIKGRDFLDVNTQDDLLRTHVTLQQVPSEKEGEFDSEFLDFKGKVHRCRVEPRAPPIVSTSVSSELLNRIVSEHLKTCIYYKKSDGWVYEYCHLKSVRQISSSKMGGMDVEYSLGHIYPPRFKMQLVNGLNYIETWFFDGEYCALKNGPRETQVRFVCGSSSSKPLEIVRVVEKMVCTYVMIVHVPDLCQSLPVYLQEATLPVTVSCASPDQATSPPISKHAEETDGITDSLAQILKTLGKDFENSPLVMRYKEALRTAVDTLTEQAAGMPNSSSLDAALTKLLQTTEDAQGAQDESPDLNGDDENSKRRFG